MLVSVKSFGGEGEKAWPLEICGSPHFLGNGTFAITPQCIVVVFGEFDGCGLTFFAVTLRNST